MFMKKLITVNVPLCTYTRTIYVRHVHIASRMSQHYITLRDHFMLPIFQEIVSVFNFRSYNFSGKYCAFSTSRGNCISTDWYSVYGIMMFRQIIPLVKFQDFRENACSTLFLFRSRFIYDKRVTYRINARSPHATYTLKTRAEGGEGEGEGRPRLQIAAQINRKPCDTAPRDGPESHRRRVPVLRLGFFNLRRNFIELTHLNLDTRARVRAHSGRTFEQSRCRAIDRDATFCRMR